MPTLRGACYTVAKGGDNLPVRMSIPSLGRRRSRRVGMPSVSAGPRNYADVHGLSGRLVLAHRCPSTPFQLAVYGFFTATRGQSLFKDEVFET